MRVLVDTTVWSLALRRRRPAGPEVDALVSLLRSGAAVLLGTIRQEVLSGMRDEAAFRRLRGELQSVPDYPVRIEHYELAAELFNRCRSHGVQGSLPDFLPCAVAVLEDLPVFTTDQDFGLYAKHVPIRFSVRVRPHPPASPAVEHLPAERPRDR